MNAIRTADNAPMGSEHENQVALFECLSLHEAKYPELALCFHVPNGGLRDKATAGQMKAAGVKPGIPDIFLPVVVQIRPTESAGVLTMYGLWIELKSQKGKVSQEQQWWHAQLEKMGYAVAVCYGWEQAWKIICRYLGIEEAK